MVKVELGYNPYLLETKVTFNGNSPRINSLVEKYNNLSLYDWINEMPRILHDEMNGYKFDLDFSGTEKDFYAIKEVFNEIKTVEIFFKNKLKSRNDNKESIAALLEWLDSTPNRNFDFEKFRNDNAELLCNPYTMIILNGEIDDEVQLCGINISVDKIDNIKSIKDVDITLVPILVCIDNKSLPDIETNISELITTDGVKKEQLFFRIDSMLNRRRIERTIKDMGIKAPQIIDNEDFSLIENYIELFPLTYNIRSVIKLLDNEYSVLKSSLEQMKDENRVDEENSLLDIDNFNNGIEILKNARDELANRDNINVPYRCKYEKSKLQESIRSWNKRKTKITNENDADKYAFKFESIVIDLFDDFMNGIDNEFLRDKEKIKKKYLSIYQGAGFDIEFTPELDSDLIISKDNNFTYSIRYMLLGLKHEKKVAQKHACENQMENGINTEVTYYNQEWRDAIEDFMLPRAEQYIADKYEVLCNFEKQYAEEIMSHLNHLILNETIKRKAVLGQMSDKDREIQMDEEWLTQLYDKLEEIKRGYKHE